jgi:transcriptional regulator with XRE-family HTH domain
MQLTITGPEIKAARLRAGLTRTQLGAAMLVHPSAVCNWENEKSGITRKNHATLHRILDLGPTQDRAEEAPPAQEANGAPVSASPPRLAGPRISMVIGVDYETMKALEQLARSEYRTPEAQVSWIIKQHLASLNGHA